MVHFNPATLTRLHHVVEEENETLLGNANMEMSQPLCHQPPHHGPNVFAGDGLGDIPIRIGRLSEVPFSIDMFTLKRELRPLFLVEGRWLPFFIPLPRPPLTDDLLCFIFVCHCLNVKTIQWFRNVY